MIGAGSAADWSDQHLLARFVSVRDEDAFAVLMERHGPLVWSTCRRMLHDTHAAEDAFQATFMILVRKARTIRRGVTLPSWLHRVAFRVALYARTQANRLRTEPTEVDTMPAPEPNNEAQWKEIRPILDEEINRLPEKYRAPIVLCYLQGKTNEEAARLLGWTKGTVSGRLARAREMLRTRLTRRGVTLSAGAFVGTLAEQAGSAAVPASLTRATIRAASWIAAGHKLASSAISATTVALVKGVMQEMFTSKVQAIFVALFCAGVMTSGTGAVIYWGYAQESVDKVRAQALTPPPTFSPDDLVKLQGTWRIARMEFGGSKSESEASNKQDAPLFAILAHRFRLVSEERSLDLRLKKAFVKALPNPPIPVGGDFNFSVVLDPTQKPKTIDFYSDYLETVHGIYRVDGNSLEICAGFKVPRDFKTNSDPGITLIALQRVTSNEQAPKELQGRSLELARAKQEVARELLRFRRLEFQAGRDLYQLLYEAAQQLRDSDLELAATKEQRIRALQDYLDVLRLADEHCSLLERAGRLSYRDTLSATYRRIEAEQALERERMK
jgi:RNA polymerase sigma factor (sigma-70 family)